MAIQVFYGALDLSGIVDRVEIIKTPKASENSLSFVPFMRDGCQLFINKKAHKRLFKKIYRRELELCVQSGNPQAFYASDGINSFSCERASFEAVNDNFFHLRVTAWSTWDSNLYNMQSSIFRMGEAMADAVAPLHNIFSLFGVSAAQLGEETRPLELIPAESQIEIDNVYVVGIDFAEIQDITVIQRRFIDGHFIEEGEEDGDIAND